MNYPRALGAATLDTGMSIMFTDHSQLYASNPAHRRGVALAANTQNDNNVSCSEEND